MKKSTKVWLIVAACLMVIGIVVSIIGLGVLGFDFAKMGTQNMVTNTYEPEQRFSQIRMDLITADVTFVPSESGKVKVVCYDDVKIPYSVHVDGDTLVISCKDNRKWYDHIGFSWIPSTVTVHLPAGEYGDLKISCTTGDLTVPEQFTFRNADIDLTTGDTHWKAGVSQDISVNCTTGAVILENVLCSNLNVRGTTGDVRLTNVQAAQTMTVKVATGDVKLSRVDAGEITIKATTGDVTGTLLSSKAFVTEVTTGDVHVPQTTIGGPCTIKTTTGDIDITIE